MTESIVIRSPTTTSFPSPVTFQAPAPSQLLGVWHVTHSSIPYWKNMRNVTVTFLPSSTSTNSSITGSNPSIEHMDDTVTYQTLTSSKVKTICGSDTFERGKPGVWNWRGAGWMKIVSTHWEILGYGRSLEGVDACEWVVKFFTASMFGPAGLEVSSRGKARLPEEIMRRLKEALEGVEDEVVRGLSWELFDVHMD